MLELHVADLLSMAGYSVTREMLLGHKKVDIYFEERRLGSTRRVAVECKCHGTLLTQREVSAIYANYLPLYNSNLIDEILIVTMKGVAPSAEAMIRSTRELAHLTFEEIQSMIMDFKTYLIGLVNQYAEDGLEFYYVPMITADGEDLDTLVDYWLQQLSNQPLAILGSYGIGKTSFARNMSYLLAKQALDNPGRRIPIFLKLGEISSEQSLEGLLGKAFTSTAVVRNYTFDIFMKLNSQGRFVVFLDGFDEMKHTLSWDEFQFNFKQLNRLVVGNSKVILLGRPTAFLSNEEHRYALHGIRIVSGAEFREPDWPDYQEVHLAPFGHKQVEEFLDKYLRYKYQTTESDLVKRRIYRQLKSAPSEIASKQLADIARRPVQLRMLAEILPQWDGDLSELTVSILYSVFIDLMIKREQEKIARLYFGTSDRRKFARQIALWLWRGRREMNVKAEDIPVAILKEYKEGRRDDLEAIRRDLVSACFLEKKASGALYFPHRSFQEFLVAEEIAEQIPPGNISFSEADGILTEETARFLASIVNVSNFRRWENRLNHKGTLSLRLARIWSGEAKYAEYLFDRLRSSQIPWYPLFVTIGICESTFSKEDGEALQKLLSEKLEAPQEPLYALLCFLCIVITSIRLHGQGSREVSLALSSALLKLCLGKRMLTLREQRHAGKVLKDLQRPSELFLNLLSKFVIDRKQTPSHKSVNVVSVYPFLCRVLREYCLISDWAIGNTIKIENVSLPSRIETFGFRHFDHLAALQDRFLHKPS